MTKEIKDEWAVVVEENGCVHVKPVKNGEIIDTPIEEIITYIEEDTDTHGAVETHEVAE